MSAAADETPVLQVFMSCLDFSYSARARSVCTAICQTLLTLLRVLALCINHMSSVGICHSPPLPSLLSPSTGEHLRTEMDTLRAKLRYLTTAHDALQTDISVTKRATEKADVDMTQAQVDKEKQVGAAHTHAHTHVCT